MIPELPNQTLHLTVAVFWSFLISCPTSGLGC